MDLFEQLDNQPVNRLPRQGEVLYYGQIFTPQESVVVFDALLHGIAWEHDEAIVMGKKIVTPRQVSWYADQPFSYHYSHSTKIAKPWPNMLLSLKKKAEQVSGEVYNACLLNLYADGRQAMGWHSDNEAEVKAGGAIASLSFGAERKFLFKHKCHQDKVSLVLQSGSLLMMKGDTQRYWLHRLPPSSLVKHPRINLTFRYMNSTS